MPDIRLTNINKAYVSGQRAVKDLDLLVPDGSFTCLLGPSGCGKTTTLRMIAGLEHPTWGTITVGDRVLDAVEEGVYIPPERRGMGLVFQSYALWPHLTINQNVEFGLRMKKMPAKARAQRIAETLQLMQIENLGGRYPAQLSGGQQQRVSLARMLAVDPTVLLLDEPLSNLDARLRLEMRAELKRLHDATGHTFVFVTHDQIEAMTMATHVAVMHDGVLEQMAPPMEVYRRPATRFVAEFVGSPPMNFVDLTGNGGIAAALRAAITARGVNLDEVASVGVRPESLHLGRVGAVPQDALSFTAEVTAVLPTGSSSTVSLTAGEDSVYALAYDDVTGWVGAPTECRASVSDLHLFGPDGRRLTGWDTACAPELEEVG